jgi:hypothetical protein
MTGENILSADGADFRRLKPPKFNLRESAKSADAFIRV